MFVSGDIFRLTPVCTGSQVDAWSLGVLLFAILCGSLPFNAKSIPLLIKKIMGTCFFLLPSYLTCSCEDGKFKYPKFLSEGPRSLIDACLRSNPDQRATLADILTHPWLTATISGAPSRGAPTMGTSLSSLLVSPSMSLLNAGRPEVLMPDAGVSLRHPSMVPVQDLQSRMQRKEINRHHLLATSFGANASLLDSTLASSAVPAASAAASNSTGATKPGRRELPALAHSPSIDFAASLSLMRRGAPKPSARANKIEQASSVVAVSAQSVAAVSPGSPDSSPDKRIDYLAPSSNIPINADQPPSQTSTATVSASIGTSVSVATSIERPPATQPHPIQRTTPIRAPSRSTMPLPQPTTVAEVSSSVRADDPTRRCATCRRPLTVHVSATGQFLLSESVREHQHVDLCQCRAAPPPSDELSSIQEGLCARHHSSVSSLLPPPLSLSQAIPCRRK